MSNAQQASQGVTVAVTVHLLPRITSILTRCCGKCRTLRFSAPSVEESCEWAISLREIMASERRGQT